MRCASYSKSRIIGGLDIWLKLRGLQLSGIYCTFLCPPNLGNMNTEIEGSTMELNRVQEKLEAIAKDKKKDAEKKIPPRLR